jgi:hypothetical protein
MLLARSELARPAIDQAGVASQYENLGWIVQSWNSPTTP